MPPTIVHQSPKTAQTQSSASTTTLVGYPFEPPIEDPTLPTPPPAYSNTACPIDRPRTARSGDLEEEEAEGGDGHETVKRKTARANDSTTLQTEQLGRPKSARALRFDDNTERINEWESGQRRYFDEKRECDDLEAAANFSSVPLPDLTFPSTMTGQQQDIPSFDDPIQQQATQVGGLNVGSLKNIENFIA